MLIIWSDLSSHLRRCVSIVKRLDARLEDPKVLNYTVSLKA